LRDPARAGVPAGFADAERNCAAERHGRSAAQDRA